MSRLIDANANREKFKEIVYQTLNDCTITTKEKFNIIMTAFDNMPTAYDVEKVVAELEKQSYEIRLEGGALIGNWHSVIDTNIAIAKVRKGGVE